MRIANQVAGVKRNRRAGQLARGLYPANLFEDGDKMDDIDELDVFDKDEWGNAEAFDDDITIDE
jgi:hypothetical protein